MSASTSISVNGEKLRELREGKALDFVSLSVAVDVDRRTLSNYERKKGIEPRVQQLFLISRFFNVPMESLLKVEEVAKS